LPAIHAVLCAAGYNLHWLLRAIVRRGIKPFFCACGRGGVSRCLSLGARDRACSR